LRELVLTQIKANNSIEAQGSTVFADLQLAFEVLECARKAYEDVTEGRTPEQLEKLADTYM
jgi:hypothetical protein